MISPDQLQNIVDTLVSNYDPEEILVFGSYAVGQPRPDSDLDLLVIKDTEAPMAQRVRQVQHLLQGFLFRIDVNVYTPLEVRDNENVPFSFTRSITLFQGKTLYSKRYSDFASINGTWDRYPSAKLHDWLRQNPSEWRLYQSLYKQVRTQWPEKPLDHIVAQIEPHPEWIVGDFGCGEAELAGRVRNRVVSLDHVAIDSRVVACDMAKSPLKDATLDVAVFSLALLGTNWRDYIAEAHRALKPDALLLIAEPIRRWPPDLAPLQTALTDSGFAPVGEVEKGKNIVYITARRVESRSVPPVQ